VQSLVFGEKESPFAPSERPLLGSALICEACRFSRMGASLLGRAEPGSRAFFAPQ
jgi:hypothetical protein